jgi:hypothetical protein
MPVIADSDFDPDFDPDFDSGSGIRRRGAGDVDPAHLPVEPETQKSDAFRIVYESLKASDDVPSAQGAGSRA